MNIFDMFRGTPPQGPQGSTPPGATANGGAATGATPPGAAPNGWVPPNTNNGPGPNNSVTPGSSGNASGAPGSSSGAPVDDWSKMWETAATKGTGETAPTSLFDIKPEQIQAAAKNMNFASGLDQATVQKALQGDVASFMAVINQVGQQVYAQTSFSGMRLMDAGINKFGKNFSDVELPKHFQTFTADHALRNANPVFADKKYAPMLDTFKQALLQANPTAQPQEIQATAERFLKSMIEDAQKVSASSAPNNGTRTGNATGSDLVVKDQQGNDDWSQFFSPMGQGSPQGSGNTQW
jgi:hypothetical protein